MLCRNAFMRALGRFCGFAWAWFRLPQRVFRMLFTPVLHRFCSFFVRFFAHFRMFFLPFACGFDCGFACARLLRRKHFYAGCHVNHVERRDYKEEKEKYINANNDDCSDIVGVSAKQFRAEKTRYRKRNRQQNEGKIFLVIDKRADLFFKDYEIYNRNEQKA